MKTKVLLRVALPTFLLAATACLVSFNSNPNLSLPEHKTDARPGTKAKAAKRPNIVLIMADDMGYSDLGCYGSEIPTPNLDKLAKDGVRFTQFYNTARCCPTRAALLTGLFQHQAGIGHMTKEPNNNVNYDYGVYGYRGELNRNCVTLAEVIKSAGYHTYMAGKWHLGSSNPDLYPRQRGFDRYYGLLAGASSYLDPIQPRGIWLDNQPIEKVEQPFYTTDAFTDHAIDFLSTLVQAMPFRARL